MSNKNFRILSLIGILFIILGLAYVGYTLLINRQPPQIQVNQSVNQDPDVPWIGPGFYFGFYFENQESYHHWYNNHYHDYNRHGGQGGGGHGGGGHGGGGHGGGGGGHGR